MDGDGSELGTHGILEVGKRCRPVVEEHVRCNVSGTV